MANDSAQAPQEQLLAELAYWKTALHEMQLRPVFLRGIAPGGHGQLNASGMLLIPEWLEGEKLVQGLRGIARSLGAMATGLEEEMRRQDGGAISGNGGPEAMIGGRVIR